MIDTSSIKGFKFNETIHKYDYNALDNKPQTDTTLAISGKSADAKATGDAIHAIQSAVGSPLVAGTASAMTDTSKIYVYVGSQSGYVSGNWYYYNGSSWVSGGVYNSIAISTDTSLSVSGAAADSKTVGDALADADLTFSDDNDDGNIVITKG